MSEPCASCDYTDNSPLCRCDCHQPRTVPEMLDSAKDGTEFGAVILGLFGALEKVMDEERPADARS